MSRQLEPNELVCFGFSYFDCEARRHCSIGTEEIEVVITMFRGMRWRFVIANPTLTIDEIKELTAYRVLEHLEIYTDEARKFAKRAMEESCPPL